MKYTALAIVVLFGVSSMALAQDKPATPSPTVPVAPQNVTITLSQDELKALVALLDAGVKAGGLNAVPAAARLIMKLQEATKTTPVAPAPTPTPKPEEKK